MTDPSIQREILGELGRLNPADQKKVLTFARSLAERELKGTPGKDLLRFAGAFPEEDLKEMARIIEEDCERVDPSEW
ncbi:MAG: hypothetical protein ACE145_03915 [Terriglobia bacterium]